MSEMIQIADGVRSLTDMVPLDGRISWVPPDRRGFEPHNKYLITREKRALLLDTGVAAHEGSLLASLGHLIGDRHLTVLVTRNELDCLGNLAAIVDRYPECRVLTTNALPVLGLVHPKVVRRDSVSFSRVRHGETLTDYGFPNLRIATHSSWRCKRPWGCSFRSRRGSRLRTRGGPTFGHATYVDTLRVPHHFFRCCGGCATP